MKRIMSFVLVFVFMISFAACAKTPDREANNSPLATDSVIAAPFKQTTPEPTAAPSVTAEPTVVPTEEPTAVPTEEPTPEPPYPNTPVIYTDGGTTFALYPSGELWAWGDNDFGQVGNGKTKDQKKPVKIMEDVRSIAMSTDWKIVLKENMGPKMAHVFAIKTDGSLWAWGCNADGALGDGTTENRLSPVHIMDGVSRVYAYPFRTFVITEDGVLWAWGDNTKGTLCDGTEENRLSPVHIMDGVIDVASCLYRAYADTCILKDNSSVWAWGWDYEPGTKLLDGARELVNGEYGAVFALMNNGSVMGWKIVPIQTEPELLMDGGVKRIYCVSETFFFLKYSGELWIMGDKAAALLGGREAHSEHYRTPSLYAEGIRDVSADVGNYSEDIYWQYFYFIRDDSTFMNTEFSAFSRYTGSLIEDTPDVKRVFSSGNGESRSSTFILKNDGTVWARGYNGTWIEDEVLKWDARLGDGTTENRDDFVLIIGDVYELYGTTYVCFLASGDDPYEGPWVSYYPYVRTYAVMRDGSIWAWGYNEDGLLGDGGTRTRLSPVKIMDPLS